ncbi:MAG: tetratricopeptide repeat protein, partial [Thermoguttaceae bacterium]
QSMADRYSYLPLVGIFILLAWLAADTMARWPWLTGPLAGLTSVALVACCLLTFAQVRRWASAETLFTYTAAVTEDNSAALTNLGLVSIHKDDYAAAERQLHEALRLDPTYIDALGNLGSMYVKQKNFDAAIQQYERILSLCPRNRKAFSEMARALSEQGNQPQAEVCLGRAVELEPASVELHFRLAETQQRLGKTQEALGSYSMVLRLRPGERGALNNIAWIHATHPFARFRDGAKAVELLLPLAAAKDCDANLLDTLAAAYAEAGRFDEALQTVQEAIDKARDEKTSPESLADMQRRATLYKKYQAYRDQQLLGWAK